MTKLEIIFGVSSVIGLLIAVWQTIKARNQSKDLEKYKYLFELAGKSIEKEKTQEELEILKSEKQRMDEAIQKEIPRKAHLTVLYDRLKDDESNLVTYYHRYLETKQEYDRLSNEEHTAIPESLIKEIENQILPDYVIKEKKDNYLRILTVISYISALLSATGIFRAVGNMLLLTSVFPLMSLGKLSLPKDPQQRDEYYTKLLQFIAVAIAFTTALMAAIIYIDDYNESSFYLLVTITIVLLFLAALPIVKKRNKKEHKQ